MSNSIALFELQETRERIKARKERELALIKEKVNREIQTKYTEIEQMKAEELNKLTIDYNTNKNSATEQYNLQLTVLQQNLESDKKRVIDLTEQRKKDILESTLIVETSAIEKEFNQLLSDIDELIEDRKDEE